LVHGWSCIAPTGAYGSYLIPTWRSGCGGGFSGRSPLPPGILWSPLSFSYKFEEEKEEGGKGKWKEEEEQESFQDSILSPPFSRCVLV
jgi:hypothetical protein